MMILVERSESSNRREVKRRCKMRAKERPRIAPKIRRQALTTSRTTTSLTGQTSLNVCSLLRNSSTVIKALLMIDSWRWGEKGGGVEGSFAQHFGLLVLVLPLQ